jgi:hypothetical protein
MKKNFKWGFILKKRSGLTIYEISGSLKSMRPIRER